MHRILPLALLMATVAEPAVAGEPPFHPRTAVSEQTLLTVRGTQAWQLTRSNLASLSEAQGDAYLQWVGRGSRTQMDVWWGTTGASLIATAVRGGD